MKSSSIAAALLVALCLSTFLRSASGQAAPLDAVNDATATENLSHWNNHYVPSLDLSDDAKVGKHSIAGSFGFTQNAIFYRGADSSWNLTRFEKMRFWAKAEKPNGNLLVMLLTDGFGNRRDATVALTTEWQLFELAFNENTFDRNAAGKFTFTKVEGISFYNNDNAEVKIWIDGLEFVGEKAGEVMEAPGLKPAEDEGSHAIRLLRADPFPHLGEATLTRTEVTPRYDLPPQGFNRENSFKNALVNFDLAAGWKGILQDAEGYMCLSMDQSLRGVPNLKVELIPTGKKPRVTLVPPQPIRIDHDFDILECWAYGHKTGATMTFQFRRKDGSLLSVGAGAGSTRDDVNPKPISEFWNLVHVVLPHKVESGAELIAITATPNYSESYKDPTLLLYFDQLRLFLFSDYLKQPAPQFKDVGKIVDNFPTTPDGACPRTVEPVKDSVEKTGEGYRFSYASASGEEVAYLYAPRTGSLSDLSVSPKGKNSFQPAFESGPIFDFNGAEYDAAHGTGGKAELVSQELKGERLKVVWRYAGNCLAEEIAYEFHLKGKTLVVEASSQERFARCWLFGKATGVPDARVIDIPFMWYCPGALLTQGLFVTYHADWYKSNVSAIPTATNEAHGGVAYYNWRDNPGNPMDGYSYYKRTDGLRQPFREVFYITASSDFNDTMLTVANPPSPMKEVLKTRLYRMTTTSKQGIFANAGAVVDLCAKYGVTDFYFLFHAPLFFKRSMGCEAFPGDMSVSLIHEPEGGDQGLIKLFAHMRDLGIYPGYYDGYPARDVTSANFHYDWVTWLVNGDWNNMWRCPALKPWSMAEYAATLYKERAKKYGARVSYQDGITSWIITYMQDFDHRVPESGTLRETMRALATGWQRCREAVNGPVFSEGRGSDYFTAGLNDGDYSKLKGYWDEKPCTEDRAQLLVDFRLRKLGELSAPVSLNIGYAGFAPDNKIHYETWYANEDSYAYLHHFLSAQIAFASIGMLEPYWASFTDPKLMFNHTLTCYFMMRQVQERYIMEPVEEIGYFDGKNLLSVSDALRADVVKDNLLRIRYRNGLTLYINMNWDGRHWTVQDVDGKLYELPPGGWLARQGKDFLEFSALVDGRRIDFVDSPAYTYLDGNGKMIKLGGVRTDKQAVLWKSGPHKGKTLYYPEE